MVDDAYLLERHLMSTNVKGAIALIVAMLTFVVNDSFIKLVAARLPPSQIMVLRGLFAVSISLVWVYQAGAMGELKGMWRNKPLMLRGVLEGIVAITFITALAFLSLPDITAIFMLMPFLISLMAALIYKEQVSLQRWCIIAFAFFGVCLVLKPTSEGLSYGGILALISAFLAAYRDVLTSRMSMKLNSTVIMLVTSLAVFITGLLFAPSQMWVMPQLKEIIFIALAAVVVTIGNYYVIVAFRGVDVSFVSGFRYSIIIFAMIAGYFIFGDIPDTLGLVGIAIIVACGLYSFIYDAKA